MYSDENFFSSSFEGNFDEINSSLFLVFRILRINGATLLIEIGNKGQFSFDFTITKSKKSGKFLILLAHIAVGSCVEDNNIIRSGSFFKEVSSHYLRRLI